MPAPTDGDEPANAHELRHPDLSGIAGEMRAEWRAEQEEAAADAAAQWRHERVLADWLRDRMHAGDRVAVTVATQTFVGLVEEVGADLLALRCSYGRVEIHVSSGIPLAIEVVNHATEGGTRAVQHRGFREVLYGRDEQAAVRVGTLQHPDGIEGTLLLSRDFIGVVSVLGVETIVPIAQVAWVSAAGA
jgi:hypothetical protein